MKQPKVSILVPIYNVEKYLYECLDSLINQTLRDIEIICINDGSTDGSLDIIKKYMKIDKRVHLINKKNSGYGDSMNKGLEIAKGEYVGILESDDFASPMMYEVLYRLAEYHNAEVVRSNYYHYLKNQNEKFYGISLNWLEHVLNPREEVDIFYQAPAIWSAIYKNSFLKQNKIKFLPTPGASYQDTGFSFKVWALAKRVYFIEEAFLHYRLDNENSSVNNPGKVFNVCYEYEEIKKFLEKNQLIKELGPIMEVAKTGPYWWNLLRLKPNLRKGFINKIKSEFNQDEDDGILDRQYFTKNQLKRLWLMQKCPTGLSLIVFRINDGKINLKNKINNIRKNLTKNRRLQNQLLAQAKQIKYELEMLNKQSQVRRLQPTLNQDQEDA